MQHCLAIVDKRRCPRAALVGAVFCDEHMKAPAGRRGGWLSAWKRKVAMAPSPIGTQHERVEHYADFANLAPPNSSLPLYVGGRPPFDRELAFDALVLCARELQPERLTFRGTVIRCPIPDDALTKQEIEQVLITSSKVKALLEQRKKVLVTCRAGLNRSALVCAITLARMTRMTQPQILAHIRTRRDPECLFNENFRIYLQRFIEGSARVVKRG